MGNRIRRCKINEIGKLKSVLAAFSAFKEADERGMLNDVANDLRVTYNQLKSFEDAEMTIILGEICRMMLKRIFKIFGRHGIKCV